MASKLVLLRPEQHAALTLAGQLFSAPALDVSLASECMGTLRWAIDKGFKADDVAETAGVAIRNKKGKLVANTPFRRHWRHAQYLNLASESPDGAAIVPTLTAAIGQTESALAKVLAEAKPAMIAAGLVKDTGRPVETEETRSLAFCYRIVKRLDKVGKEGIKATTGASSDLPAFPARTFVRMILSGKSKADVTAAYRDHASETATDAQPVAVETPVIPDVPKQRKNKAAA